VKLRKIRCVGAVTLLSLWSLTTRIGISQEETPPANPAESTLTTNSPPASTVEQATNTSPTKAAPDPSTSLDIDPSLRASPEALATKNLLSHVKPGQDEKEREMNVVLEQGRQFRRGKDWERAEKTLTSVLTSQAPHGIHRSALLELALLAQDRGELLKAQQIYAQYIQQFKDDPNIAEVLLRQGLLYREMGAPTMALSKFYSVMSTALSLKLDRLGYYQRLVLQAQTEIAETYYLDGKPDAAAEFYKRILKLENPELNRGQVTYKLVRSYSAAGKYSEAVTQAQGFLTRYPESAQLPEVRFVLSDSLKHLGRKREALQEVLAMIQEQRSRADLDQENWRYWQQKAGNEIANQLYNEGDHLNALEVYLNLSKLDAKPQWRLPSLYQAGLVYERLKQQEKAAELYVQVVEGAQSVTNASSPSLAMIVEMAQWRKDHLAWQTKAAVANQQLQQEKAREPEITQ
jgi:tetratricopeptide (TPR) repeat protein